MLGCVHLFGLEPSSPFPFPSPRVLPLANASHVHVVLVAHNSLPDAGTTIPESSARAPLVRRPLCRACLFLPQCSRRGVGTAGLQNRTCCATDSCLSIVRFANGPTRSTMRPAKNLTGFSAFASLLSGACAYVVSTAYTASVGAAPSKSKKTPGAPCQE